LTYLNGQRLTRLLRGACNGAWDMVGVAMGRLMRRGAVAAGAAVVLLSPAAGGAPLAVAARAVLGGTWGTAMEVPGIAALNTGGDAYDNWVSCATAGNCSAGGSYTDSSGHTQVFVVSQVNGTWGKAIEIPGTAALNTGGDAYVSSVSCAAAGSCSAGGYYYDSANHGQAFVVSQVNGTWGKAKEVPGTAALNTSGNAAVNSVSCAAAGSCSAGGFYRDSSFHQQAFVVSQVNGTWGKAKEVPGTAALNTSGNAAVNSVSCAAAGSCSAGGDYRDSSGHRQAFVVSQVNGTWGKAKEVPGATALNAGGSAAVYSVSCRAAGSCSAGGDYRDSSGHSQAFVVSQVNGTWGKAIEVPGAAALNTGGAAQVNSVWCAAAGSCSASGTYIDSSGHTQVFVVSQVNGTWGTAIEVPGTAALNTGGFAEVFSVSCAAAGSCSSGGYYTDSSGHRQAFVVSQVNGTWGTAIEVPGTAALNAGGGAGVSSVSCAALGNCGAGGWYTDSSGHSQAFVVSQA